MVVPAPKGPMPAQDNFSARRLFIGVRGGLPFDPRSRIHAFAGHQRTPKKGRPQAEAAQLSVRRSNQTARIATILWPRSTMMISSPTTKYQNPRHCGWMSTMTEGTSTTRTLVGTAVPTLIEKLTLLTRYIAAGQDCLSDLSALLRRQADAATCLALLSLTLLGLPLLADLTLLTLLPLRGLSLGLVSLLALRLRLLVLLPLALARGLIALLLSLARLLGLTLLAAILLRPLLMLALGRLARGLLFLPALRLALRALLRWPLHVVPALGLAARSGL